MFEGTKEGGNRLILLIPLSYFVKRALICLVVVFWIEFLWGQIAILIMTQAFMVILLQWNNWLESKFLQTLETFNEVITLCCLYSILCFSDWISDS